MRRSEMNRARLDRDYPHQIALPEGARNIMELMDAARKFGAADRHKAVVADGQWFTVWCFSTAMGAELFTARFGGEPIDPADVGKGNHWNVWERKSGA